jgi:hypothetical protein
VVSQRPELGLPVVPMMVVIDNAMPQFLVSDLLAMRQAWYGLAQKPAEEILADDPEMKAALHKIPKRVKTAVIGEMAVSLGWVASEDVAQAVGVQVDVESDTGLRLLLGTILVLHDRLDAIAYYQLLALRLLDPRRDKRSLSPRRGERRSRHSAARRRAPSRSNPPRRQERGIQLSPFPPPRHNKPALSARRRAGPLA